MIIESWKLDNFATSNLLGVLKFQAEFLKSNQL